MTTDKFVAFTDMLIDGRRDTIAWDLMPEILSADEIKANLISNDVVTLGNWPSGYGKLDFEVRFYNIGDEYADDPVKTVPVWIHHNELPGYDEEFAAAAEW